MEDLPFNDSAPPSPTQFTPPTLLQTSTLPPEGRPAAEIQQILSLPTFAEQVDTFASLRNYFAPEENSHSYAAIKAYLSSSISASEAVEIIAKPIEEAYITADHGRQLKDPEKKNMTYDGWTTEGYLWDLYYSILHAARRIPWDTKADQQERLVDIVKNLKTRPDPDPPAKHLEIEDHWVLSCDKLWSGLLMMGPSSRESWNDSPGCGAGWQGPEVKAWSNVSAFVARLARDNVFNFWTYGVWAMREGVENEYAVYEKWKFDACVPAAVAWIIVAGKQMYEKDDELMPKERGEKRTAKLKFSDRSKKLGPEKQGWALWKERMKAIAEDESLKEETRALARNAFEIMGVVETGAKG